MKHLILVCGCILLSASAGCSGSSEAVDVRPDRHPVKGTLTYNSKPAKGASVILWKLPLDLKSKDAWRQVRPAATVEADGSFVPNSYDLKDGAMAGDYAVTAIWTGENAEPGPDLFKGRFSNPEQPVLKVTIKQGDNVLPAMNLTGPAIDPRKAAVPGDL